jgi:hypothetical protein
MWWFFAGERCWLMCACDESQHSDVAPTWEVVRSPKLEFLAAAHKRGRCGGALRGVTGARDQLHNVENCLHCLLARLPVCLRKQMSTAEDMYEESSVDPIRHHFLKIPAAIQIP